MPERKWESERKEKSRSSLVKARQPSLHRSREMCILRSQRLLQLQFINHIPMPPRIPALRLASPLSACLRTSRPVQSFLLPIVAPPQHRSASILSDLRDVDGAYNKRKRKGRGPASGTGKTSGRGHKGQKQHGKVPFGFNGGQTPDEVVAGKRGFVNVYVGCQ